MQKVLITGVNGFVGQHLIHTLDNYSIIGLTHEGSLEEKENQRFIPGNILDKSFLEELILKEKPENIIHLAAKAISQTAPEEAFQVNFFGTLNLYQAIINAKKDDSNYNPKILFISSSEIYGNTNNPENIKENDVTNPVNFYGTSKLSTDRLSYQLTKSHNLNIIILRAFNHIGPGQQKGFFVTDMVSQIIEIENDNNRNEILVGNLDSIRDFTDVRDIVEGYKLALEKETQSGEVYNLCSGRGVNMSQVLEKLLKNSSKQINIKQDPSRMRPSDMPITVGNNSKFSSVFGWSPKRNLDETLKETLEYWRNKESMISS